MSRGDRNSCPRARRLCLEIIAVKSFFRLSKNSVVFIRAEGVVRAQVLVRGTRICLRKTRSPRTSSSIGKTV